MRDKEFLRSIEDDAAAIGAQAEGLSVIYDQLNDGRKEDRNRVFALFEVSIEKIRVLSTRIQKDILAVDRQKGGTSHEQ